MRHHHSIHCSVYIHVVQGSTSHTYIKQQIPRKHCALGAGMQTYLSSKALNLSSRRSVDINTVRGPAAQPWYAGKAAATVGTWDTAPYANKKDMYVSMASLQCTGPSPERILHRLQPASLYV